MFGSGYIHIWIHITYEILDISEASEWNSNSTCHTVTWCLCAHKLLGTCQERMKRTYAKHCPFFWNTLKRNNIFIRQCYTTIIWVLLTYLKVNKIYKQCSPERQHSKILRWPLKVTCWWHILPSFSVFQKPLHLFFSPFKVPNEPQMGLLNLLVLQSWHFS